MHRSYWLVATDLEAERLATRETETRRNPFTGALVEQQIVRTIDEPAVAAWATRGDVGISPWTLAAALECVATAMMSNDSEDAFVFRLPIDLLARIVATDAPTLAGALAARLQAGAPHAPAGQFRAMVTDARVAELRRLAQEAVERGGTVWCFEVGS